jgi:hypothetical protein
MSSVHFKKTLIHTCTVQRATLAASSSGELIPTWADVTVGVRCRYVQKAVDKALENVSLQEGYEHLALMCNGEDVREEDRIVNILQYPDETSVDAGPFTVESFLERNANLPSGHHISLGLERVE